MAGLVALSTGAVAVHGGGASAQDASPQGGAGSTGASGGSAAPDILAEPTPFVVPPSVLPPTGYLGNNGSGTSVRPGNLQQQISKSFQPAVLPPAATGPAWQFVPSIGVTEELTDNAQGFSGNNTGTGGGKRGDLISILQPGINVNGDTQRLQVNLAYSPQVYLYARDGSQDRVAQNFNGRALATLIPQTLFLDVRGFGFEEAIPGGAGPSAFNTLPSNQTEQNYTFSATPYLVHRFGDTGTGEVGYTIERTIQSATGTLVPNAGPVALFPLAPLPANQRTTTQNVHGAFVTGQEFGRYSGTALASATHFDGQGVLSNAHRNIFTVDNGYAITRTVTLLATAGYEDIRYSGTSPLHITDAIWDAGFRVTPNADTTLTMTYGHRDGLDSLTVDGALAPTPRTRVYVRYSTGLSTDQEQLQNALATTDLDVLGNPVDHTTGAPIFAASNFFGVQDTLSQLRRLSISGSYMLSRDTFLATVENDRYKVLSFSGLPGSNSIGSNSGTYGSISWLHELSPRLNSTLYFQYGLRTLQGPPSVTQDTLVASALLTYALGPNLNSTLQFSHDQTTGGGGGNSSTGNSSENLLLLSVVKTF